MSKYQVISCSKDSLSFIAASGNTPAHSTMLCSFVVNEVNKVNLTDYLSILTADTRNPWMQGYETVKIKDGLSINPTSSSYVYDSDDFEPEVVGVYDENSYVYYRIYFSEYVKINSGVHLFVAGTSTEDEDYNMMLTCLATGDTYRDNTLCYTRVASGKEIKLYSPVVLLDSTKVKHINSISEISGGYDYYILYDMTTNDVQNAIVYNGSSQVVKTMSKVLDRADNLLDVTINLIEGGDTIIDPVKPKFEDLSKSSSNTYSSIKLHKEIRNGNTYICYYTVDEVSNTLGKNCSLVNNGQFSLNTYTYYLSGNTITWYDPYQSLSTMVNNIVVIDGYEYSYNATTKVLTQLINSEVTINPETILGNTVSYKVDGVTYTLNTSNRQFTWYDIYTTNMVSDVAVVNYLVLSASNISNSETIVIDDLTNIKFDTTKIKFIIDNNQVNFENSLAGSDTTLDFNVINLTTGQTIDSIVDKSAFTKTITYTNSTYGLTVVITAYEYKTNNISGRHKLVLNITISGGSQDIRLTYRFAAEAFIDSADNPNKSAIIYEGALENDVVFIDNIGPSAFIDQDELSVWNDLSGNDYNAKLTGAWNADYDGYTGIIKYTPDLGDIYETEEIEGINRDSFVNNNFFAYFFTHESFSRFIYSITTS